MKSIVIKGGRRLKGNIPINGAKNAAIPMAVAAMLTKEEVILHNVHLIEDLLVTMRLMRSIGVKIRYRNGTMHINAGRLLTTRPLLKQQPSSMPRSTLLMAGALLPRLGKVVLPLPVGCKIGTRNIDFHEMGLGRLGAKLALRNGYVEVKSKRLAGNEIFLPFPSVGCTENLIIASCCADGTTTIHNAAREPEVVDLAKFLNALGCKIRGVGTNDVTISGVECLRGTEHVVIPDRIETGTYMTACAIAGGRILIKNSDLGLLRNVVARLKEIGVEIKETGEGIEVFSDGELSSIDVATDVYPGFPTDMQPIITSLLCVSRGQSKIRETIFDGRFVHVRELKKMGANLEVLGDTIYIDGVKRLTGARVKAHDIRSGAALVVAGLAAKGETIIDNCVHIDRGYENWVGKLRDIGAKIGAYEAFLGY